MQQLPQTKQEASEALRSLIDEFIESLTRGKASQTLEYDTAIDLAVELGATRTTIKLMDKFPDMAAIGGLVSLLLIWRAKYEAIHGAD